MIIMFSTENEQQMSMVAGYLSVQFSLSLLYLCFVLFFNCVSSVSCLMYVASVVPLFFVRMAVFGTDIMHYSGGIFDCENTMKLIKNIFSFDNETKYDNKYSSVEFLGFHALTTVGVTNDYFIVKNSWGNKWGIDGYFYLKRQNEFGQCNPLLFIVSDFYGLINHIPNNINNNDNKLGDQIARRIKLLKKLIHQIIMMMVMVMEILWDGC